MAAPARPAPSPLPLPVRRAAAAAGDALAALARVRPRVVVGTLVVVQWLAVLALAHTVTHNGWIYYQGGDQLWYYTTGWLLAHGHMPYSLVSYGWSMLMAPFSLVFGPNVANAMPAIVALQFVVLLPLGLVCMFGIGQLIGGRLFGYWTALLWLVVPFFGILYTKEGYHQRYTELTLPQGFGLTAMADFSSMVLLVVATYFLLRALRGGDRFDAAAAGLVCGLAIAVKPSNALYLAGVVLALAWTRRAAPALAYALGLAPSLVVLAFWKWHGYGYVPLLHAEGGVRTAASALPAVPLGGLNVSHYLSPDWGRLGDQLAQVREHFWSVRLVEWAAIAGSLGLLRRSRTVGLLAAGWFFAFAIAKTTSSEASIESSSLLRILLPAAPAFVLLVASLPLLLPRLPGRLSSSAPAPWGTPRLRLGAAAAFVALCAVAPLAVTAAAHPLPAEQDLAFTVDSDAPVPVDQGFRPALSVSGGVVRLEWPAQAPHGGRMFYRVYRSRAGVAAPCKQGAAGGAFSCALPGRLVRLTFATAAHDRPGPGRWVYRVAAAANWESDLHGGDAYLLSPPLPVTVRS